MKITAIIPILYKPKNDLYKKAIKSLVTSWKKLNQDENTLEIILFFNNFPVKKTVNTPKFTGVKIIKIVSGLNRGFTGAVNDASWLAVYKNKANWSLIINDDATVDEDFFESILPELRQSRSVVSCGVRSSDGSLQSAGLEYFQSGLTKPLESFMDTPFFTGTAFFVSSKTIRWSFNNFGWLLADFFFAYAEDLELSIRLMRENKKTYIYSNDLVTHLGSITAKRGSAFQLYWGYRNLLFIIILHWSWWKILISLPMIFLGQLYILGITIYKGHWLVYPRIVWSLWKNFPLLFLYRKIFYEKLTHPYSL